MGARGANYKFPAPHNLEGGKKKRNPKQRGKKYKQSTKPNPASLSISYYCLFSELARGS